MMDDERRTLNDERRRTARAAAVIRPLVIVDYGVGNLRNVHKALEAVGAAVQVVTSAEGLANAAGIVLPGVGAFGDAATNLRSAGFEAPLLRAVVAGTPLLGICVGMQLLFDESEEMGRHRGLGIIPGRVVRFPGDMTSPPPALPGKGEIFSPSAFGGRLGERAPSGEGLRLRKVPQIGWNQLHHSESDPLLAGVPTGAYAYFVHSYYCAPTDPSHIIATTDYGLVYASVVRRGMVWGIQCHPEKSQAVGLRILRNFVEISRQVGK